MLFCCRSGRSLVPGRPSTMRVFAQNSPQPAICCRFEHIIRKPRKYFGSQPWHSVLPFIKIDSTLDHYLLDHVEKMLVQFSPFTTVKTSVKLPKSSRRRKRNQSDGLDLPVEASFITTSSTRGQVKWKQHSAEFSELRPLLLVSSDHQISAIGRSKDYSYDEFSSLQYSSRPGSVSSFAPPPNGKESSQLPRISPILDAKNENVYALQHGNSRLCCWHPLKANGPDEKHAIRVDLAKPAVSMSLLPLHRGIIYGSCIDGTMFIARLVNGTDGAEVLDVEYLPSKVETEEHHAGTTAELPDGYLKGHGRKRKMSDADGRTHVNFYQVFYDSVSLHLVRHEVHFERLGTSDTLFPSDSLRQNIAQIPLMSGSEEVISSVQLYMTTSGPAPKVSVMYRVEKKGHNASDKCYAAMLSMTSGNLAHNGVALPSGTQQCGMISETLLVVTDQTSMYVYDLETASLLQTVPVPPAVREASDGWLLCADSKFGTVAAIHETDGVLHCSISFLMFDENYEHTTAMKLSLSSKLASSVIDANGSLGSESTMVVCNLLELRSPGEPAPKTTTMDNLVEVMLQNLEAARLKTVSPDEKEVEDFLFMNTFDGSVATILASLKKSEPRSAAADQHNPQDDLYLNGHSGIKGSKLVMKKGPKNGVNGVNGINGVHTPSSHCVRAFTPAILPQAFIDGAATIVLKLLQAGNVDDKALARRVARARLDARIVLSRLLRTGKLSARHHFDGIQSIQSSNREHPLTSALRSVKLTNKRGRRYFSPVDMMMIMLQKCPDVSERQMVVMLSYMMRRALPEDIANIFYEERKSFLSNHYTSLTHKYFAVQANLAKAAGPSERGPLHSQELTKLGHQLILAGTSYVLYRIVSYSQCNEAMLRVAMQDEIEKHEAIILARLLSNMLAANTSKGFISKRPPSVNATKSTCQWVAALCDTFHDELSTTTGGDGKSYLASLLGAINLTTKHSQEIISLKEDIRRVEFEIQLEREAKNAPVAARALPYQEDLPGYSVEKLLF